MKNEHLIYTTKGITSKTIQSLYKIGWTASISGSVHILRDKEGKEVLTAYSWVSLLNEVEKLMR